MPADLAFADVDVQAGVRQLRRRYAQGLSDAAEVTRRYLARIDHLNPRLNAFLDLDAAGALAAADASRARWAQGRPLSAIDGVPVGVKANIAVQGLPWTAGMAAHRHRIAHEDAACVARLRAAGAVVLGTLNMDEGALGASGDNPWFGRSLNPHHASASTGGSSAGSAAAVAAGLCAAALGTDTMGSVRIPAACCGVVGLCPLPGVISDRGVVPLARSHDSVGLLARSVPDVVSLFAALTGADAGEARFNLDPPHAGNDAPEPTLAVLLLPEGLSPSPAVAQALAHAQDAARAAGFALEPLRLDGFDPGPALKALLLVVEAEAWVVHQPQLLAAPETFSKSFRAALEWGGNQPAGRLAAARELLRALRRSVRAQLKPFAGLLLPTLPQTAPAADEPLPKSLAALTVIGSIAGLSGISLPMGAAASASGAFPGDAGLDSLPRAVQILAGTDECVLSLALRLSRSLPAVPQPAGFLD